MRLLSYFTAVVLLAAALAACQSAVQNNAQSSPVSSAPPTATVHADGVRRITPAELKDLLAKDQAVVIDVRSQGSYDVGHIRGARLIPNTEILTHLQELPRNKLIVTYCS